MLFLPAQNPIADSHGRPQNVQNASLSHCTICSSACLTKGLVKGSYTLTKNPRDFKNFTGCCIIPTDSLSLCPSLFSFSPAGRV